MSMERRKVAVAVVLGLLLFGLGWYLGGLSNGTVQKQRDFSEIRHQGNYRFINPLLECDNFDPSRLSETINLEDNIRAYIERQTYAKVSVYYRDLNNGPWFGIGADDSYAPASLLKVPILLASLRQCQFAPDLHLKTIKYDSDTIFDDIVPNFQSEHIQVGQTYTVDQLMERMIRHSDNGAKDLLLQNFVSQEFLDNVWNELGLRGPDWKGPEHMITVKEYSSFFRILYNATYLNRDYSEMALRICPNPSFDRD